MRRNHTAQQPVLRATPHGVTRASSLFCGRCQLRFSRILTMSAWCTTRSTSAVAPVARTRPSLRSPPTCQLAVQGLLGFLQPHLEHLPIELNRLDHVAGRERSRDIRRELSGGRRRGAHRSGCVVKRLAEWAGRGRGLSRRSTLLAKDGHRIRSVRGGSGRVQRDAHK